MIAKNLQKCKHKSSFRASLDYKWWIINGL